mmetsp:Transcript_11115/g.17048  ORF Transcript_11115/g.17048 Transcript_11115/m.17048 type:complete len:415 (+) Transcript_11115:2-1246(+)
MIIYAAYNKRKHYQISKMKCSFSALASFIVVSAVNVQSQYIPAKAEQHVIDIKNNNSNSGCLIWNQESPVRNDLELWRNELHQYTNQMNKKTQTDFVPDLRRLFNDDYSNREEVCRKYADANSVVGLVDTMAENTLQKLESFSDPKTVELKQSLRGRNLSEAPNASSNLMEDFFNGSQQLSYLPTQGYMEPLVPPLRHPDMCQPGRTDFSDGQYMALMDYLIEDYGHICRNVLTKNMRTVFLDIGARYKFDGHKTDVQAAAIKTIEKYRHNGIHFDHIYAYEVQEVKTEAVYDAVPDHMQGPLHWVNIPASPEEDHKHNPWTMLLESYHPEDFIVVKLDIDTPSVEMPLFNQLLTNPELQKLVDVFYFEHHVKMDEMKKFWGDHSSINSKGTITESLEMFQSLRKAGVAAHYWI